MATPGNTLKVCNCNRTMKLDGAALGRALGREAIPIYTELCRKELDGFTSSLRDSSCTVACTQEAKLFGDVAEEGGKIVGCAALHVDCSLLAEVRSVAVDPADPALIQTVRGIGYKLSAHRSR